MNDTAAPEKRGRGRPRGSSWLNEGDAKALADMADLVLKEGVPPTTAAHRIGFRDKNAALRRLQRKWVEQGERLLAEARERKAQVEAQKAAAVDLPRHPTDWTRDLAHIRDAVEGPLGRAMRMAALEQTPFERMMRDAKAAGAFDSFTVSPAVAETMKRLNGIAHDPALAEHIEKISAWSKTIKMAGEAAQPEWLRNLADLSKKA